MSDGHWRVNTPAPCPSRKTTLSLVFCTGSQTSPLIPVAHCGKLLGNAAFLSSFPSLTHFPTHLPQLPELSHKLIICTKIHVSGSASGETKLIRLDQERYHILITISSRILWTLGTQRYVIYGPYAWVLSVEWRNMGCDVYAQCPLTGVNREVLHSAHGQFHHFPVLWLQLHHLENGDSSSNSPIVRIKWNNTYKMPRAVPGKW